MPDQVLAERDALHAIEAVAPVPRRAPQILKWVA